MAHFICRWIQIAKKIIAKSRRESDQSRGGSAQTLQPRQATTFPPNMPTTRPNGFAAPTGHNGGGGMFVTNSSKHIQVMQYPLTTTGGGFGRTFNGSENDLTLNYNGGGSQYHTYETASPPPPPSGGRGGIRYTPEGRSSPEVQMYKTRVIYHSRQDCASDHEASV